MAGEAPFAADGAAFFLGFAAPDAVLLAVEDGVLEAVGCDGAFGADGACGSKVGGVLFAGLEQLGVDAKAGCVVFPLLVFVGAVA